MEDVDSPSSESESSDDSSCSDEGSEDHRSSESEDDDEVSHGESAEFESIGSLRPGGSCDRDGPDNRYSPAFLLPLIKQNRDLTRALLYAKLYTEKTCRQTDRPPWSFALHLASKAVRFWKTFISGARNAIDVSYPLSMICAELQWDRIPTLDLPAAKVELNQAQKDLQECRAHAAENRQQFLSDMVDAALQSESC
jgi:hypothetical protein